MKTTNLKILYVEDQTDVRELTTKILSRRYKNLFSAENGQEGLKKFNEQMPEIVVTDIKMPVMDGLSMVKEIKNISPHTRIILTTAHSDMDYFIQAIELGINHYILKPVDVEQLYTALEKCIHEIELEIEIKIKNQELLKSNLLLKNEIEERKIIERELIISRDKAKESDRLKTSFLANMSHEIRTPLNSILGFAELLKSAKITQEKKERYIGIINDSGKDLLSIINDVIDISKIEAGQVNVTNVTFSLNLILDEIFEFFEADIHYKNKEIKLQLHKVLENSDSAIIADDVRLRQILKNLISNAIKFTSAGNIEFGYSIQSSRVGTDTLEFYVKDTGIGIDTNKNNMIFERFRQADESTTREFGGTGLGLSISKSLVEMMGGNIWLNSELGKGATFYFTIPFIPEKRVENISEIEFSNNANWINKNILIVEDLAEGSIYLEDILESSHAKIIHAVNGEEAIKICNTMKIDIVLMDLHIPIINGYEATKRIKEINSKIPVIVQTANVLAENITKAYACGCDDFLMKPITQESLYKSISKQLNKIQML